MKDLYELSVLIPTTHDRADFMQGLMRDFRKELAILDAFHRVEILIEKDNYENTIGWKRNQLLQRAEGKYVAYFDSDDKPGPNYFRHTLAGIAKDVDCCSLKGIITENGLNPLIFEHSIKYNEYRTNPDLTAKVRYERFPNHLNTTRASIAKQMKFPLKNHFEDTSFAEQLHASGLLKTEHYIEEVIYHYLWRKK